MNEPRDLDPDHVDPAIVHNAACVPGVGVVVPVGDVGDLREKKKLVIWGGLRCSMASLEHFLLGHSSNERSWQSAGETQLIPLSFSVRII